MSVVRWPDHRALPLDLKIVIASTLVLPLLLCLWRLFFMLTDWAAVFLLLLAAGLFWAIFFAGVFTVVAVFMLGWLALTNDIPLIIGYVVLVALSSGFVLAIQRIAPRYLSDPFVRPFAAKLSWMMAAVLVIPALAWINFAGVSFPETLKQMSFAQVVTTGLAGGSDRTGPVTQLVSVFRAIEGGKLWITIKMIDGKFGWAGLVFSLDAALAGTVLSSAAAYLTSFFNSFLNEEERPDEYRQPDTGQTEPETISRQI